MFSWCCLFWIYRFASWCVVGLLAVFVVWLILVGVVGLFIGACQVCFVVVVCVGCLLCLTWCFDLVVIWVWFCGDEFCFDFLIVCFFVVWDWLFCVWLSFNCLLNTLICLDLPGWLFCLYLVVGVICLTLLAYGLGCLLILKLFVCFACEIGVAGWIICAMVLIYYCGGS